MSEYWRKQATKELHHIKWCIILIAGIALLSFLNSCTANSAESPSANPCPGYHVSDFVDEALKNKMVVHEFEGKDAHDLFLGHLSAVGGGPTVTGISPASAAAFYYEPAVQQRGVLITYFDDRECLLTFNVLGFDKYREIKLWLDRRGA